MTPPHPLSSAAFWRAYWVTLRPYLFFVSGVSGLVGLAMLPVLGSASFVAAFLAFFFSYGLGQALTDVFQTDTDRISSPYRPLTQGVITPRQVVAVSLVGLAACAATFFALNPWTIALSALGVVGLATYTPFKRRWWGGPFWNAWIVALLPAIGVLCGVADPRDVFGAPATWFAMGSVFFSYAVFVLLGYFKDISADRATLYETLPVKFGWRAAILVSIVFTVAAAAMSAAFLAESGIFERPFEIASAGAMAASILGFGGLALAHVVMARTTDEREAHRAIALVVRGYVLAHLGEAIAASPALIWPSCIFYLLCEVALVTRPERAQI